MKEPNNQKELALWYLLNYQEVTMKQVINDSLFFKFNTRLSELENEYGVFTNKVRKTFLNRFKRGCSYLVYSIKDREKGLELYNHLQSKNIEVNFVELN